MSYREAAATLLERLHAAPRHRWFQLVASLIAMIMIANFQYAWTLFVRPLQEGTGWKLSDIQWGFTLFILFQTWVQPLEGWLIDRMGPRLFISIAGVLCGVGWAALGTITTPAQLYIFYAVTGIGSAFVYSGSIASALKWFPDRRGLASGIIAAGFGSGTALFVPIIAYLIRQHNYKTAFLWTGIFQGLVILVAAQFLRHPDRAFSASRPAPKGRSAQVRRNTEQFTTGEMLRTPQFYLLYIMFVMMATGGLLVTAQAGPVAVSWGITAAALTVATALNPIANGASRIFWGWLSDRIGRETTMFIAFTLQAGCLLSVLVFGRLSGLWFAVTLVLTFFTWGEIFSIFPSTVGDYFGTSNAASNYGFMYTAKGVASIIGGGVAALLFEQFGSWSAALYGSAVLALLSGVMALALRAAPLPRKVSAAIPEAATPAR